MKKGKTKVFEIDINYSLILCDGSLVPLIFFMDDYIANLLDKRRSVFHSEDNLLRVVPSLSKINEELQSYLRQIRLPNKIFFVLDSEIDDNYVYVTEVLSNVKIKVDKTLLEICSSTIEKAYNKILSYDLEQINTIKYLMYKINYYFMEDESKIIKFPKERITKR